MMLELTPLEMRIVRLCLTYNEDKEELGESVINEITNYLSEHLNRLEQSIKPF
jgi:hypothetical protein